MKTIPLTQGKVAVIDDEDFELVSKYKWCAHKNRNKYYAETEIRPFLGKRMTISMHRLILGNPESPIDHKDGDGLKNTRSNLRLCTNQQNQFNQSPRSGKSSQYKGVSFDKGMWRAQIKENKKSHSLGNFENEIDAARAYDYAAKKLYGEFARLNFPNE